MAQLDMAYYLSKELKQDVVAAYQRYQQYLREHEREFPRGAFALGTAEWYQNVNDHRCPHDAWLEHLLITESGNSEGDRRTLIRIRLLGAYQDGYIEFSYPQVFAFSLEGSQSTKGLGDWLCDEFRLYSGGHVIHEIEWAGLPSSEGARWTIEASDVEFRWMPHTGSTTQ